MRDQHQMPDWPLPLEFAVVAASAVEAVVALDSALSIAPVRDDFHLVAAVQPNNVKNIAY